MHHGHRQAPGPPGAQPAHPLARNYAKAEYGGLDDEALEALGTGALRKAVVEGDLEEDASSPARWPPW